MKKPNETALEILREIRKILNLKIGESVLEAVKTLKNEKPL